MTTRQLILDTETTGLDPKHHRLVEVAILEMQDRVLTGRYFHSYFNPEQPMDPGAQAVHGLSDAFLKDKPKFTEHAEKILHWINGAELIIHNAPFDTGFLTAEFKRAGHSEHWIKQVSICDTLRMARERFPNQKNNLDALCKRLNVDTSKRTLHGALIDCELLSQVYLALTGGQVEMFDATWEAATVAAAQVATASTGVFRDLISYGIDAVEQEAHQRWMADLKKKGRCLWEEVVCE